MPAVIGGGPVPAVIGGGPVPAVIGGGPVQRSDRRSDRQVSEL